MLIFSLYGLSLLIVMTLLVTRGFYFQGLPRLLRAMSVMSSVFVLSVSQATADLNNSHTKHSETLMPMVIANSSVTVSDISLKKLRAFFAMKQRFWSEGSPVTVYVLPKDNPTHGAFCKKILNIFPNQLESVWYRQVYTGTGQAPVEVRNESDLIERVSSTPGAIGYLDRQSFDMKINNNNDDVKRLSDEIKILTIQ